MNENETKVNEGGTLTPSEEKHETKQTSKTFTQEEVNQIVSGRINDIYSKYGVSSKEELDKIVGLGKKYNDLSTELETTKKDLQSINEKVLISDLGLDNEKVNDIKFYFKGKGIDFNEDNLKKELENHQEWKKNIENIKVGKLREETKEDTKTESEMAAQLFGLKGFIK